MSQALEAADAILAKADATPDEIDAAKAALETSLSALVKVMTNTFKTDGHGQLNGQSEDVIFTQVEIGQSVSVPTLAASDGLQFSHWIDASGNAFVLDAAISDSESAQVFTAIFVKAPDKSALQELVDAIAAENLQEGDWTEESWIALETARTAAHAVLKDGDVSQEAIDAAKTALESARKGLEERPVLIDTALLEQAIEKADAIDTDLYRWSGLMPMILQKQTAQAILARPRSQQQVNEAAFALNVKLLAL